MSYIIIGGAMSAAVALNVVAFAADPSTADAKYNLGAGVFCLLVYVLNLVGYARR